MRKALDLFQRGGYRERLTFDGVVALANTRMGDEVAKPFKLMSYEEVVNALQQLEGIGYPIKIENEGIRFTRFTRYPWQIIHQLLRRGGHTPRKDALARL